MAYVGEMFTSEYFDNEIRIETVYGETPCACCGQPSYGCNICEDCIDGCDPAKTWHCFTGNCDGSGCSVPGECEK